MSWDSKFWTTIIPLLTKPGKVSRDYIDGKRMRYANPFRFYLTISVLFFLIIGATESYDKFEEYRKGKVKTDATPSINSQIDIAASTLDPNSPNFNTNINEALKKIDSTDRKELLKITPSVKLDSIKKDTITNKNQNVISFLPNWSKFSKFQRKYPKVEIEDALDSLSVEHTFFNRFLYSRVKAAYEIGDNDNDKLTQLKKQFISYVSISLFVFLPLFTLFLKLFYVRRKYTYVEHLVFVFHTQTVFFLLSIIFYLVYYFKTNDYMIGIFLLLFVIYLYLAMRKFYQQRRFKTFLKFVLINFSFFIISTIGAITIALITFMMY
ncbi:MAG: DUF3667 domain-containing protein [Polaribacter sp.]|nr:DUF3667 domain-containing protein [Polaribacter sp.]MDG1955051.1 DUF3667 domain-containing protein [Polaribacter sp.]MDG2074319.1 DUF3667 domain-containing protein [Polaribacter sp.]